MRKHARKLVGGWRRARIACQRAIDASLRAKAEHEYLYDKPYGDRKKVRVAGSFTAESLSPHCVLGVDENDELLDPNDAEVTERQVEHDAARSFVQIIFENLKTAGVQQAHTVDWIVFMSLAPWPGDLVCTQGHYEDVSGEKRAAVFIGPEFGTVLRPDLVAVACEAGDGGFDLLVACAFNHDAHSSGFAKLGRIPRIEGGYERGPAHG